MVWEQIRTRINGGRSRKGFNPLVGEDTEGDVTVSGTLTLAGSGDSNYIVKYYRSLTLSASATLTTNGRCQALILFIDNDLTLGASSTITTAGGASAIASTITYQAYNPNGLGFDSTGPQYILERAATASFTSPAVGGSGGARFFGNAKGSNVGSAGAGGQTGGGGSGGCGNASVPSNYSGAGGAGTAFSGGPGGGSLSYDLGAGFDNGRDGGANGGAGGNAGSTFAGAAPYDPDAGGGGAGNFGGLGTLPNGLPGTNGTGGVIIIICGGSVTINSGVTIKVPGFAGGASTANNISGGGGGSGSGRLITLYAGTLVNNGTLSASGGVGGASNHSAGTGFADGGAGGAGSITLQQIGL